MKTFKDVSKKPIVIVREDSDFITRNIESLIYYGKHLAELNNCESAILVSDGKLSESRKLHYLKLAFPAEKYISENELKNYSIIECPKMINEDFDHKIVSFATQGNHQKFKKYLPSSIRDIDSKRLMNEMRTILGYDEIKEQIKFDIDELRDKYYKKEIFNIGNIVEQNNQLFEIVDRGTNYIVVINENGEISRKWIQDVVMSEQSQLFTDSQFKDQTVAPNEISYKGYTSKNLHRAEGANKAFQKTIDNMGTVDPIAVLNALKATDEYLEMTPEMILANNQEEESTILKWTDAHTRAKRALDHCGEFVNHVDYWHLYKDKLDNAVMKVRISSDRSPVQDNGLSDKDKVTKMIANVMGVENGTSGDPSELISMAFKNASSLNKESVAVLSKIVDLAESVGIHTPRTKSKLTTEQIILAMERAERYGRRYPNPIDNSWALNEGKAPSITVAKGEVGSMASLRKDDEEKLTKLNKMGKGKLDQQLNPADAKSIENYANTGHTDGIVRQNGVGQPEYTHVGASLTTNGDDTLARMKANKLKEEKEHDEEMSDKDIDKEINKLSDDDYLHAYDEDELYVINAETGEKLPETKAVKEDILNEVLSKIERIKAKLRMAKYASRIEVKRMLALKHYSTSAQVNKRARKMAIHVLRKKILKGQDYEHMSTSERERIDKIVEKKAKVLGRMAMKLVPKIRQLERDRLSHKHFTEEK